MMTWIWLGRFSVLVKDGTFPAPNLACVLDSGFNIEDKFRQVTWLCFHYTLPWVERTA
jgi:hypothetical protein